LAGLLGEEGRSEAIDPRNPLAARPPHFAPKAKRVIFLFMHGGPSQMDTFDYKPLLNRDHGKPLPFAKPRVVSAETGNLLRSPLHVRPARPERYVGERSLFLTSPGVWTTSA